MRSPQTRASIYTHRFLILGQKKEEEEEEEGDDEDVRGKQDLEERDMEEE